MKTYPFLAVILILAVFLSSCSIEDNSPGGGVVVLDTTPPSLFLRSFSVGYTNLTVGANERIRRAVADDNALLANITVTRTPSGGGRGTDNLAKAVTFTNNSLVIAINPPVAQGDEWFVEIAAGLVQDAAGNSNNTVSLSGVVDITPPILSIGSLSPGDNTLTITADEVISRVGADNSAFLAGITVTRSAPVGGRTGNLLKSATLTANSLVITISSPVVEGDEWFVDLAAGLVQDEVGNVNKAVSLTKVVDTILPKLNKRGIFPRDTTITITADEDVSRVGTNDNALLAGITVNRTPSGGVRGTNNLATAATLTDNKIVITIDPPVALGDKWFVKIASGLVQDAVSNINTAVSFDIQAIADRFSVEELPRSKDILDGTAFVPDNYRTHFVVFSIKTYITEAGEYRLGLKEASKDAPSVSDLTNARAAITRTLSASKINIYLPFHIEGAYFDTGVTQDYTNARATLLSANTEYSLYITRADGSSIVENPLKITTDPFFTNTTGFLIYGLPPSIYEYTIREREALILQGVVWNGVEIGWLDNSKNWRLCSISACTTYPPFDSPSSAPGNFYVGGDSNQKNYIAVIPSPSGVYSTESTKDGLTLKLDTGKFLVQYEP